MAKAPATPAVVEESSKALVISEAMDFEQFRGAGLEEVRTEDLSIPFLRILAQLSPQVNKRDGKYIQGAEPGMMFNTVTNELFDGEKGVLVIPAYYHRKYIEWVPKEKGGGFKGSYDTDNPIVKRTTKNERGEDILPNGNLLSNTAQFFILLLTESGPQRCLLAMSSTQLKRARKWLSVINNIIERGKDGKMFTMPMMSHIYRVRTVEERNDKGSWFGYDITMERRLSLRDEEDAMLFAMAMEFNKGVRTGEVQVKESDLDDQHGHGGDDSDGEDLPF
jgi:hypothetical protein